LVFEASNDGVTYTTIQTIAPPKGEVASFYPDLRWSWYEIISPAAGGSLFFRVRETSGGTLKLRELYLGNNISDIPIARLNREQYLTLPNKGFSGRPLQFYLERVLDSDSTIAFAETPRMVLWPVPDYGSSWNSIALVRHRYIADVTDFNAPIELPIRWYDSVIWWVASYLAAELPEVPMDRELMLAARADKELGEAIDEERDNSPVFFQPDLTAYNR
jgi:hypothetical protein